MPVAKTDRLISKRTAPSAAFPRTLVHSDVRPLISPSPSRVPAGRARWSAGILGISRTPGEKPLIWAASFWGHCSQIAPCTRRLSYYPNAPRVISPSPLQRIRPVAALEGRWSFSEFRELEHRLVVDHGSLSPRSPVRASVSRQREPRRPAIHPAPYRRRRFWRPNPVDALVARDSTNANIGWPKHSATFRADRFVFRRVSYVKGDAPLNPAPRPSRPRFVPKLNHRAGAVFS